MVDHAIEDGSADERMRTSVNENEDKSANERVDDVITVGTDGCRMKGGKVAILIKTKN